VRITATGHALTDAAAVLRLIREASPSCVSVVNANILAVKG
jgi:hypothetical protein